MSEPEAPLPSDDPTVLEAARRRVLDAVRHRWGTAARLVPCRSVESLEAEWLRLTFDDHPGRAVHIHGHRLAIVDLAVDPQGRETGFERAWFSMLQLAQANDPAQALANALRH